MKSVSFNCTIFLDFHIIKKKSFHKKNDNQYMDGVISINKRHCRWNSLGITYNWIASRMANDPYNNIHRLFMLLLYSNINVHAFG